MCQRSHTITAVASLQTVVGVRERGGRETRRDDGRGAARGRGRGRGRWGPDELLVVTAVLWLLYPLLAGMLLCESVRACKEHNQPQDKQSIGDVHVCRKRTARMRCEWKPAPLPRRPPLAQLGSRRNPDPAAAP